MLKKLKYIKLKIYIILGLFFFFLGLPDIVVEFLKKAEFENTNYVSLFPSGGIKSGY